jgi:hypothetical protein
MVERRAARTSKAEALIWRDDLDVPPALDATDREAIHIVIRIAFESDEAFRKILRCPGSPVPTKETDYLCDTIRSGIDFFAIVSQTAAIIRGVVKPKPRQRWTLTEMLVEHGKCVRRLETKSLNLSQRMTLLLALIQIETIFFGHFWLVGRID